MTHAHTHGPRESAGAVGWTKPGSPQRVRVPVEEGRTATARLRTRDGRTMADEWLGVPSATQSLQVIDEGGPRTFERTPEIDQDGCVIFVERPAR